MAGSPETNQRSAKNDTPVLPTFPWDIRHFPADRLPFSVGWSSKWPSTRRILLDGNLCLAIRSCLHRAVLQSNPTATRTLLRLLLCRLPLRAAAPLPHQIERGTAGNHGESHSGPPGHSAAVSPGQSPNRLQMAAASQAEGSGSVLTARPTGLALVDGMATWLRPVEVQRGIRVHGRSASPPSWLDSGIGAGARAGVQDRPPGSLQRCRRALVVDELKD